MRFICTCHGSHVAPSTQKAMDRDVKIFKKTDAGQRIMPYTVNGDPGILRSSARLNPKCL